MTYVTPEALRSLEEEASPPCVSLYLPTHRGGAETQQSPIRLKNLLRQTEEQLDALGNGFSGNGYSGNGHRGTADELLAEARKLVDDHAFWQRQSDGLALFLAPGVFRTFSVPVHFAELAFVGERFHLAPLLRLLEGDGRFHVLALAQNDVHLFEATRHTIREVDLGDVPRSLQDALNLDQTERSLQHHSAPATPQAIGSRGGPIGGGQTAHGGRRQGMFHGHGGAIEDGKEQVQRFIQVVDDALVRHLRKQPLPMVVAAVDYELAMYREHSKHPHLLPDGVEGNPQLLSPDALRERAWAVVEPVFLEGRRRDEQRFADLAGSSRTSADLDEVLVAAADGRVDALFVDTTEHRWGRFDLENRSVETHDERRPGDEDLVDRAAFECLARGGTIHALDGRVPGGGPVAAVFRY